MLHVFRKLTVGDFCAGMGNRGLRVAGTFQFLLWLWAADMIHGEPVSSGGKNPGEMPECIRPSAFHDVPFLNISLCTHQWQHTINLIIVGWSVRNMCMEEIPSKLIMIILSVCVCTQGIISYTNSFLLLNDKLLFLSGSSLVSKQFRYVVLWRQ